MGLVLTRINDGLSVRRAKGFAEIEMGNYHVAQTRYIRHDQDLSAGTEGVMKWRT